MKCPTCKHDNGGQTGFWGYVGIGVMILFISVACTQCVSCQKHGGWGGTPFVAK